MKLPQTFYTRPHVVQIAQELLGKRLCSLIDNQLTAGIIVETEAYAGQNDKACHAHLGKRTSRTEIMYRQGGVVYTYLCYGIHHLFNIITNEENKADAVLIRAIAPTEGIELMLRRRKMTKVGYKLTAGPGVMSQAMGITTQHYGESLLNNLIWIEDAPLVPPAEVIASPRVGIGYAGEDALLPWRFRISGNVWCSKPTD